MCTRRLDCSRHIWHVDYWAPVMLGGVLWILWSVYSFRVMVLYVWCIRWQLLCSFVLNPWVYCLVTVTHCGVGDLLRGCQSDSLVTNYDILCSLARLSALVLLKNNKKKPSSLPLLSWFPQDRPVSSSPLSNQVTLYEKRNLKTKELLKKKELKYAISPCFLAKGGTVWFHTEIQ